MRVLRLTVPTYNRDFYHDEDAARRREEFGDPEVPVVIREEAGVRILLGTHDPRDGEAPDVLIERHPRGWMIFLHPLGSSDPCAFVFFADDGRSFILKESFPGPTPLLQEIEQKEDVPEICG
jgi:hypothetical protein